MREEEGEEVGRADRRANGGNTEGSPLLCVARGGVEEGAIEEGETRGTARHEEGGRRERSEGEVEGRTGDDERRKV